MDRKQARVIAKEELEKLMVMDAIDLKKLMDETKTYSVGKYNIRAHTFWDDEGKGLIRLCVEVSDETGWSSYFPVAEGASINV